MSKLRIFLVVVLASLAAGCFRWAPVSSLDDAVAASRVRVETKTRGVFVLERPTVSELRDLVVNDHAKLEVRKLNAWATALIATAAFLTSAMTGIVILGVASAGIAGG